MVDNRFIIRLLFLVLFSFYTISPISYIYASEKVEKNISNPDGPCSLSKKISIYLWELIYTQLVSTDDPDTDQTARFLLKKKRAIVPKNVKPKSVLFENFSLAENYFILPFCLSVRFCVESKISKPFKIAQSLHSGLSPPQV